MTLCDSRTEQSFRASLVQEALTWIGTPYANSGRIKGVGVNCAQFLYAVAKASVLPDAPEPRTFTAQLCYHTKEERIAEYIKSYGAHEIEESEVGPGDIVLYKIGQAHGHAAIVIDWPSRMIHATSPHGCYEGHGTKEGFLASKHRRYFSLWNSSRSH
jgi:cell wall-associated NlpC family hydrolase